MIRDEARTDDAVGGGAATPRVSVVMNGFNSARYLNDAIASLRQQTVADWEVVFWDNCSADETESIVRGYADSRLRFHRSPRPMSLAEGRNEAIRRARGQWIAFLDCDDLWEPDKLARQLHLATRHPELGLVYCRTRSFSARGDEGETTYRYADRPLPEGDVLRALLLEGNLIPIVSAMVSRRALDAVGPIPPHLTFAEDYWLFVAVASRFPVACVQDVCCHYRVHSGSATYRNKIASHREALEVMEAWGTVLSPAEFEARRRIYETLIGIEMFRLPGQRAAGLRRILGSGSLAFLLRGAASTAWRRLVRAQRPYS